MDVALDIITLCLPLFVIRNLHMSRRRKFTIAGIFWLGIFCVVAGTVRLVFNAKLSAFGNQGVGDHHFSYISVNLTIWSEIEPCTSIIAACLPTYGPLLKGGLSLQSLARSLQSRFFKRSTSNTTDPNHEPNDKWSQNKREWTELEENKNVTPRSTDLELGEPEAHGREWPAASTVPQLQAIWHQRSEKRQPLYTGHVETGPLPTYRQEEEGIRVERTFSSQAEKR